MFSGKLFIHHYTELTEIQDGDFFSGGFPLDPRNICEIAVECAVTEDGFWLLCHEKEKVGNR